MHRSFEWRTVLFLAQDPVGIQEVLEKQDAHALNQAAFNLPSRLIAKIYLFRTIFNRGKGYAFTVDPDFMAVSTDVKFWDDVGEKFYKKYAGVNAVHLKWGQLSAQGKDIDGPLGRSWTVPMRRNWRGELEIPWNSLTNYPVQGTGADIMMLARISFYRRLRASGIPAILVSTVHDSIVVDVPDEEFVQPIVNLFHQVFDDIPSNIKKIFGVDWNVPMDCECKVGLNMKDMKKVQRNDK